MNRWFQGSVAAVFLLVAADVAHVSAQAPAQGAPKGGGGAKAGPPRAAATPSDLAELAKLATLPAWTAGARDGDYSIGPDYAPAPEETQKVGIPHGKLVEFFMNSADSKIYPGINGPFERLVSVYIPSQYVPGTEAPFIFAADSYGLRDRQMANILDNMIAERRLPVMVAVMVANGGPERSLEYDTVSPLFANFVETEVLPRVEKETQDKLADQAVTFTKDPEGRGTLGGSSGGIASFIAAWYHPDLFRRVVGFSPSFVAQESPQNPEHPHGAWNFHENGHEDDGGIIAMTDPIKPIRFWMESGTNDYEAGSQNDPTTPYPYYDFAYAIPRVFLKMTTKGYPHVHLDVGTGAVHVDSGMVRATLPDAIAWAWRGYVGGI